MYKYFFICLFSLIAFSGRGQQQDDFRVLTREFISFLENGQYLDAQDMLDVDIRHLISIKQVQDLWENTIVNQGAYRKIEEIVINEYGGTVTARARTSFSSAPVIIQLNFDRDKKISGIYFNPVVTQATYALPDYANDEMYLEEEMVLEVPQGNLPATFTRPIFMDKFPVVILVHGSGPHDRDETIGPNKPFKDLAIGLATQGIATFRYDKKTRIMPQYFQEIKSNITVRDEVLEDVAKAIDMAKKLKGVNRREIYVLGHSLGGMLAPRIADENREVDGIIIMAGNARPLEELIIHQIDYLNSLDRVPDNDKESMAARQEQLQLLKAKDKSIGTPPNDLPLNLPVEYWMDLSAYDQLSVAQEIKEPILLLHGGRDYQVPIEDYERWRQALGHKTNFLSILYPALNHIFLPGEGKSVPMEYQNPGHIPQAVIFDIANWIKSDK